MENVLLRVDLLGDLLADHGTRRCAGCTTPVASGCASFEPTFGLFGSYVVLSIGYLLREP
jgi:hypothetical protein